MPYFASVSQNITIHQDLVAYKDGLSCFKKGKKDIKSLSCDLPRKKSKTTAKKETLKNDFSKNSGIYVERG